MTQVNTQIELRRVYDDPAGDDGYRVLVDGLWPRGMSKERLHMAEWDKALAPSAELREWFHADREGRWQEFESRYADELRRSPAMKQFVEEISGKPLVTLLYGSRDTEHNNAVVIADVAREMLGEK